MKYKQKSFSEYLGSSAYRKGWEQIFGSQGRKMNQGGCQSCEYDHWGNPGEVDGARKCKYQPFDMKTNTQKAIVAWLSEPCRDAFRDSGCPGWEIYVPG